MMQSSFLMQGLEKPEVIPSPLRACPAVATDTLFLELLGRYRSHGGLASSAGISLLLSGSGFEAASVVSDWIRGGNVLWLAWRGATWMPMFQLRKSADGPLTPRADVRSLAAELRSVCDELDLCSWFAKPNDWLDGQPPVAVIDDDLEKVHAAARADRFVLGG